MPATVIMLVDSAHRADEVSGPTGWSKDDILTALDKAREDGYNAIIFDMQHFPSAYCTPAFLHPSLVPTNEQIARDMVDSLG